MYFGGEAMSCSLRSLNSFPKPPLTIEEQIELLRQRKLIIENEEFAKEVLNSVSYYRLSGYTLSLRAGNLFHEGVTFRSVYQIYEFDRKLRHLLLGVIEVVEIALRTQIANHMALKYGALGYLNSSYFRDPLFHQEFLLELQKQIKNTKNKELFIRHYIEKYNGKFPIWAAVEIFSLGMLSKFFKNLKIEDQKAISRGYYDFPPQYLVSWIHALVTLRNICAHYGRLYNRTFTITPKLSKEIKKLGFLDDRLFTYIFILKYLIRSRKKWISFSTNLQAIIAEYKDEVDISLVGFPCNWYEILLS